MKMTHNFPHGNPDGHGIPLPPHELRPPKPLMPPMHRRIEFSEQDLEKLSVGFSLTFRDEDTVNAAAQIFETRAPREIQIVMFQLARMIADIGNSEAVQEDPVAAVDDEFQDTAHPAKFSMMDPIAQALYAERYGEKAESFIQALDPVPDEIAVVSRMAACLDRLLPVKKEG